MAGQYPIVLAFLDDFPPPEAARLLKAVEAAFGVRVSTTRNSVDASKTFDQGRGQYNSTRILEEIAACAPGGDSKLLAVTKKDIFSPIFTFVFGEAQLGGRLAVVSCHRLRNSFYGLPEAGEVTFERLVKEAIHELGHTFGLFHCPYYSCVMHSSTFAEDIDLKSNKFCSRCLQSLSENRRRTP